MTAYNFKAQFADAVFLGAKRTTIRANRKGRSRHARPGELLQLYTGMRTRDCRLLKEVTAQACVPISINVDGVSCCGRTLSAIERERLATNDGFDDYEAFLEFFTDTHGLPFEGVLITW